LAAVTLPAALAQATFEWEQLELTDPEGDGNPPALHFSEGAYDLVRDRFVFYGAKSNAGGRVAGLWEFDGSSWKTYSQAELLEETTADWDPVAQKVLFTNGTNPGFGVDFGRTWDGTSMVTVDPSDPEGDGNIGGSGAQGVRAAFDTVAGKLIAYGGHSFSTVHSDTWEWTGNSWKKLTPTDTEGDGNPGPRGGYGMDYDPVREEIFLFGGYGTGYVVTEEAGVVWGWNGVRWLKYVPTDPEGDGNPPGTRGSAFVYHPGIDRCVLLGGALANDDPMPDIWLWDGTSWARAGVIDELGDGNHIPYESPADYMSSLGGIVAHSSAFDPQGEGKTWLLKFVDGGSEGEPPAETHSLDTNGDGLVNLSELLRGIQFYNSGNFSCEVGTEDGYTPGIGDQNCSPHSADYAPQDWSISFFEILRQIQFFNSNGVEPSVSTEDGFAPVNAEGTAPTVSFTRSIVAITGSTVTVEVTYTVSGDIRALGLVETIPEGFTYVSSGGSSTPELIRSNPSVGGDEVEFAWLIPEPGSFTYEIESVSKGISTGFISGSMYYRGGGEQLATPVEVTDINAVEGETPSDITFSREGVPSNVYTPGGTVDVRVRVEYEGTLTALGIAETMPAGWTYVQMVGGDIPEISPANGASGQLDFAYFTPPSSPVEFTYRVRAPISATGVQTIVGEAQYRRDGDVLITPDVATVFAQGAASEPITGIVRDGRTNGPLSGASVTLFRSGTSQVLDTAATAGNGSYEVSAPDAATNVDLLFAAQGFQARRISRINAPSTVSLTLEFVAPPAPTGLEAFPAVDSVTLTWQPSAALDVAGYYLYRGEGENPAQFDLVNSQPVADTRFEDVAGLVRGDVYTYFVTAVDFDGNESEPSETAEANPGTVVMWIPNLNALPGTALRVPLNVRNASGLHISGMQLDFRYPAAWLGADAPAQAAAVAGIKVEKTVLTQSATIQVNKDTPGRVVISGLDTGGKLVGEGHLFNVFLPVAPGVTPDACELLSFQSAVFATNTIPPQALPVDFTRSGLGCIDNTCFTGDLNGDGFSNVIDVLYALQVSAQLLEADSCAFEAGEMDGDGGVNSGDAILIWRSSIGAAVNPPQNTKSGEATVAQYWRNKGGTLEAAIGTAARNGATAILPVALSNAAGISGLDLAITYPEAEGLVSLESVTQTGIASDFDLEVNEATGQVLISMSRAEALEEDAGDILLLEFSVSEAAPAGAQLPIVLSAADLRGEYGENLKWFGDVGRADGAILVGGVPEITSHQGDWDANNVFSLSEVLRLVQFYNVGAYGCDAGTEDGFAPGSLDRICSPHTADYQSGADWSVSLNELLRIVQLYNAGSFTLCEQGEDGFCVEE